MFEDLVPVGVTVWGGYERLGGRALLEEGCILDWALKVYGLILGPTSSSPQTLLTLFHVYGSNIISKPATWYFWLL